MRRLIAVLMLITLAGCQMTVRTDWLSSGETKVVNYRVPAAQAQEQKYVK